MRRTLLAISVVTPIGFGVATSPANADCPADIQAVEQRLASFSGKEKQRSRAVQAAETLLTKAKDALSAGKAMRCEKLAQKALEKLK